LDHQVTTATAKPLTEIAAQWREARRLYDVYSALQERFALGMPPCKELESPIDRAQPEIIERVWDWFGKMDERVHVHQLRQLLQTSKLGSEENLRALIAHHLGKKTKTGADRDKVDFLLVQYLSSCAPPGFYDRKVSFEEIAQVLEPVLGEVGLNPPQWLAPLEDASETFDQYRGLRELLQQRTLEKMRELKAGAGDMYFGPTALVAITRFNFTVRRTFVRLIAADLHAIRFSLNELEQKGVHTVDCASAGLSHEETLENLRQICQEWKKPFRAAYAAGQNFKELVAIRTAAEEALEHAPAPGQKQRQSRGNPVTSATPASASLTDDSAAEDAAPENQGLGAHHFSRPTAVDEHLKRHSAGTPSHNQESSSPASPKTGKLVVPPIPVKRPTTATATAALGHPESEIEPDSEASDSGPSPASAERPARSLEGTIEEVTKQLREANVKAGSVAYVVVHDMKLLLASWEVAAFIKTKDVTSEALQRAVAIRAILVEQLERRKRGDPAPHLLSVLGVARLESTRMREQIDVAKRGKDIDAGVNLAATGKRLQALIDEASKPVKK
jgi:hypothetical protein